MTTCESLVSSTVVLTSRTLRTSSTLMCGLRSAGRMALTSGVINSEGEGELQPQSQSGGFEENVAISKQSGKPRD